jgi:hypothetical protein
VGRRGKRVPCQRLLAEANCAGNWRVRLATTVDLQPWEIVRFDEYYINDKGRAPRLPQVTARDLAFKTKSYSLKINPRTGLVDHLSMPGARRSLVGKNAFQPTCWAQIWLIAGRVAVQSRRDRTRSSPYRHHGTTPRRNVFARPSRLKWRGCHRHLQTSGNRRPGPRRARSTS